MNASRRDVLKLSAGSAALLVSGCPANAPQDQTSNTVDERPLRVALVAPPANYAEKLERYWVAQSDAPFELRSITADDAIAAKRFKADVIVYPSHLLGEFAASERIAPLSRSLTDGEELHGGDLLRHARTTEVTWGALTLAVCLGSPAYCLLYRRDMFEKQSLQPPTTWVEYQTVVDSLSKEADATSVLEPLGEGAENVLLARAAAYVRNLNDYGGIFDLKTMQPLVASPPYVRALEELVAAQQAAEGQAKELTRKDALKKLLAGECAMAWGWPTAADSLEKSELADQIAIAPLPGSADVYDFRTQKWLERGAGESQYVPLLGAAGVLASVTTEARRPRAAENFLAWLSAGENAVELAASRADAAPFRRSHLAQPRPWLPAWLSSDATEQYVATLTQQNEQSVILLAPRLPGASKYAAALRSAVQEALAGKHAAEALAAAAEAFNAITERLGRSAQRVAYQRSLGLDV